MSRPLKLTGRPPVWAPFAGFSVLFDPPAERGGAPGPGKRLWTRPRPGGPDFVERLASGLATVLAADGGCFGEGWAALPPATYHVTVWDGPNDGNLDALFPAVALDVQRFLRGLPGSLAAPPASLQAVAGRSALVASELPPLELRFEALAVIGGALVVRLVPSPSSRAAFAALLAARAALSEEAATRLGLAPSPSFAPHVTLGYFVDEESARPARAALDRHERALRAAVDGASLRLTSRSLYAFEDMTTFYRVEGLSGAGLVGG
jgi:hypothetical protein